MGTALVANDVRRSISLPSEMAKKLDEIALERRVSINRTIIDVLVDGLMVYEQQRAAFFDLAERFRASTDPAETKRLGDELGRMVFGN